MRVLPVALILLTRYSGYVLHRNWPCRRLPDFAHIAMMHSGHLTIVPSDRDGIPARFGDTAAVGGIALPINPATLREAFRFGVRNRFFLILPSHRQASC